MPPVIVRLPTPPKLVKPFTVNAVSVPTLVIFGCAAVVNVPVILVADKVFVELLNVRFALVPNVLLPALLKKICVLEPAILALPVPAAAAVQLKFIVVFEMSGTYNRKELTTQAQGCKVIKKRI